jgi:proteasome lid subunit RPN8/RPN11
VGGAVTLRLPAPLLDEIRRHGEAAYPAECCGAMVGRAGEGGKEVVRLAPAVNRRTDDPHRYLIAPDDLRRLEIEVKREGLDVVGYYHSHPDHPAQPSGFDTAHAWPWYSYLIVRIDHGRAADAASWVLDDDRPLMHSETLDVLSEVLPCP